MKLALRHRTFLRTRRWISDVVLLAGVFMLLGAASAGAADMRLGFFDGAYVGDPATRATALGRTKDVGGSIVRLGATWAGIAPRRPTRPTDPDDPAYQWGNLDGAVRDAVAAGLTPLVTVNAAPVWAEGPKRPRSAGFGTWRPNAKAFGQFMRAMATRYSGSQPGLPRVRYFQVWNEPNLSTYLTPQYVKRRGQWVATSPGIFRSLVNGGYAGVKAVRKSNFLVTAGTAPYGDLIPGGRRIAPVTFLRGVLAQKTNLDAISHHPYGVGDPYRRALNAPDVAVPDIGKLRRVLRSAAKRRRVKRSAQVWVTEMSWDSNPPDPDGVPARTQADWLQEGLNVLWRQGVRTVTWFLVTDQAPDPSYAATNQGGVFLRDGTAKLSATAFRFPFIAPRKTATRASIWGRVPGAGTVVVEARSGSSWRRVWRKRFSRAAVFSGTVSARRGTVLRARLLNGPSSLTWKVR